MSKINVIQTLNDAHDEGTLSQASLNALTNIPNIGNAIQQGLGVPIDQIGASEVVLLSILTDDSSSINHAKNEQPIRDGHNEMINALDNSKQQDNIQAMNSYLNKGLFYPYTSLSDVPKMDTSNYNASGSTPLYDETVKLLGTVITKSQEFKDNGIQVRTITLILSDGEEYGSKSSTASDVKKIVDDMLSTEEHIVAAMGFDNGSCDFMSIFSEMGIPDQWILEAKATPSEIRKAFSVFSQSAVRASQSAANFSQTAMGGFGS